MSGTLTGNTQYIIRKAGLLERYHITRHSLGFDSCVITAAQYSYPEKHELDKTTLFHALRRVVETHAALGVRLSGEFTRQPVFSRLQSIDLSRVVDYSSDDQLARTMEVQFLRPFDTTADLPLWRLVVLKDNTVVFAYHHCIGDGLSGLSFHRALLLALRDSRNSSDVNMVESIDILATTTFSPAIETVINLSPSWRKLFYEIYNLVAPTAWTQSSPAWTGNMVIGHPTLNTRVRLVEISSQDVKEFLTICKVKNATLTSGLYVLCVSVLSSMIASDTNAATSRFKNISTSIPISLRHAAGAPSDVFCDYVSTYHSYPIIEPTFSWDKASECASSLRLHSTTCGEEIGMIKYIFGQYASFFKSKLGSKRQGGLELSNLGRFSPGERKDLEMTGNEWTIGRTVFAQCDATSGSALKFNVVGSPTGQVSIAVTWGEGSVDDLFAERFTLKFQEEFKAILLTQNR